MSAGRWAAGIAAAGAAGVGLWWLLRDKGSDMEPTTTPQEVEALARAIASEAGGEPRAVQAAVGYAVLNESIRRGVTIWSLVRGSGDAWGPQGSGGRSYVSSRQAPTPAIMDVARRVLSGDEPDFTDGATNFDSPRAQRALLARGAAGYTKTPEQVAANRIANGMEQVTIPGVDPDRFRMWRYV